MRAGFLACMVFTARAVFADVTVNTTADVDADDVACSLREATSGGASVSLSHAVNTQIGGLGAGEGNLKQLRGVVRCPDDAPAG